MEISALLYGELLLANAKLQALESAGVDGWECYEKVMSSKEYNYDLSVIFEELRHLRVNS